MIEKEKLKSYASKLMFDMKDEEYETLQREFDVILKQMELISLIDGIKDVEPLTFPFELEEAKFREDEVKDVISVDEALFNVKDKLHNQVKVPKVVE
ncbi:MAG: Asp-tRNA(Asn)/Glu-tRNA(Gln) amidotransferase subunit GatC [bacterium]|nr:Asp-tRNA(Asn)/Glu-tRNA(Gln) amidotransferase subunit GatC [bacterium]